MLGGFTNASCSSHINSVDKNADGDYLVSARHTSTVYKIAGQSSPSGKDPGEIIWHLGGKKNEFQLRNAVDTNASAFIFSYQHYARFIPGGIRIWDNANSEATESDETDIYPSAPESSGMDLAIDEPNKIATLIYQALAPSTELDHSQGSHQGLPNGNHFCGMGSLNEIYERDPSGALVFHAAITLSTAGSYRALRRDWTGTPPESELALFTYAHNMSSAPMAFHVSWNGATHVRGYRFYVGVNSTADPFRLAATAQKDEGFETMAVADPDFGYGHYSYAEAVDGEGNVLGRSPYRSTFVPDESIAGWCDHTRCGPSTNYALAPSAPGPPIGRKYVNY